MAEVSTLSSSITQAYIDFLALFPSYIQSFINMFLLIVLIVIYAVLIWKFYRFIGKKNIIELNLNKYNRSKNTFSTKLLAGILFLIEYIIILPIIIFIGFIAFGSFLTILSSDLDVQTIIFLTVIIVGAIRMIAYVPKYGQDVAQEVAKIIPLTLLSVFILNPSFFEFSRVVEHIGQVPLFIENIFLYLVFIIILEFVLRFFDLVFVALGLVDEKPDAEKREEIEKP